MDELLVAAAADELAASEPNVKVEESIANCDENDKLVPVDVIVPPDTLEVVAGEAGGFI